MPVDRDHVLDWMRRFAGEIGDHRDELVRLDTAIGDGDHGTNMDRGMQKALQKLEDSAPEDVGGILRAVAMVLISSVGGAAGPLYGTLFLQMGDALGDAGVCPLAAYAQAWRKGLEGVKARGKGQAGDKTMIDALIPGVEALERAATLDEGLRAAAEAAQAGMRSTIPLVARRGRASYLGERSRNHQDPGATSTYYLFKSAAQALAD